MDTTLFLALGLLAQNLGLSLGVPGLKRPSTLFPWRRAPALGRVRRAWVIPPISVSENHKRLPYPLVQIKSDKQQLGGVIYSIQGPGVDEEPRGVFSIDKFTGKVFLNATLDREKTDRFRLRAFALDLGGSTLEEPTDLEIVVVDQNDNRPVFRQEVFTGQVVEGAAPGTFVTKAEATDADDPETDNAALRYSILEQSSPQLFSIDEHTGEIRTVQVGLDREVVAVYNLTLQVADMSGDGLTATASAIITLKDVNDNAPGFSRDEFFVEAPEAMSDIDVGRLEVEDKDLPGSPNWAARFTILEGDPDGQFAIRTDPKTNEGVLSVVKPLDYESCEQYDLTVLVQNEAPLLAAAPRAQRDQARVSIQVQDVNEAPVFQENPLRTSLAEGAAPDEDLPPHGAPFHFLLSPRFPELAWNWSLSQINMSHARLRLRHQVQEGLHRLSLLLRDSGQPPQQHEQPLNVTVCHCGQDGTCLQGAAALRARSTGISLGALAIVLASVILLLLLTLPAALLTRFRQPSWDKGLLQGLQDDLRDNILNYDEQGGGEEDQDAYDISQLRHPSRLAALSTPLERPPLRRDTPFSQMCPPPPRVLPSSPTDMADFINDGLEAADGDLSVPPYDTALIYDYEGDGSMAGTLSSILSSLGDEDQDYSCLQDWGPRFARLADLYGPL
ncbi:cadherin 15 [Phyllostomus discolor]|uniref:Cadherin-15 n=1 Tax=Phyllostomus discolor TaxID=89673 RepID=A0A834DBK4_9CHIR|nr:cadherin 15 [Phyllostomus discolor]